MEKIKYLNGWTTKEGVVKLLCRQDDKKVIIQQQQPWYFFVKDSEKSRKAIKDFYRGRDTNRYDVEGEYLKVYYPFAFKESILTVMSDNKIETFESDLTPLDLYVLENSIEIEDSYRIAYIDIETDDSTGEIVVGRDRILSMAYYDNTGKSECLINDNEEELLKDIRSVFEKYDVIVGWNSKNFDIPYIKERFKKYGIFFNFNTITHIDLMKRFIKICQYKFEVEDFKLNTIAEHFLGESKIKLTKKVSDLFETDRAELIRYNLRDAELLYKLDKENNATKIMTLECQWCKVFLREFYVSKLLDMYILARARKSGIHYKSKPMESEIEFGTYAGALVLEPDKGILRNVYVFDFKSLYPSIILTFNISTDAIRQEPDGNIKSINNVYFSKDKRGLVTEIITNLLSERDVFKTEMKKHKYRSKDYEKYRHMQDAVKELTNSMYGILGDRRSRYFSVKSAEAITLSGQFLLTTIKDFLNTLGYKVIYADTDSFFVYKDGMEIDKDRLLEEIHAKIASELKEKFNVDKSFIKLNYDKHLKSVIFVTKKRYAQHVVDVDGKPADEIEYIGLECIKSDTIQIAKVEQKKVVEMLLKEDKGVEFYRTYIKELRARFFEDDIPIEDIIIRQQISKHPDQYKSRPPHVKIAEDIVKKKEEFYVGMTVEYYIKASGVELIPDRIYNYDGKFSRIYYWNTRLYPILERILESAFPNSGWKSYYLDNADELKQLEMF